MLFQPLSMHAVRSTNQRALLTHWNALAAHRRFPAIEEFKPQPTGHSPEQTIWWDVERAAENGSRRFRLRSLGLRAMEAFGGSLIGKTMDEVVPASLREVSLDAANECAASGCAIYTIITAVDANGHQVDCERLLLPFGGDGGAVEQIVACLQLISFQGPVERQGIARDFEATSSIFLSGKMSSDAGARMPPLQATMTAPPLVPEAGDAETREPASDQSPVADNRPSSRRKGIKTGKISFGKYREICTVRDMSPAGASIELADPTNVPDRFTLVLEMESASRKCAVTWRKDRQIGVRFG